MIAILKSRGSRDVYAVSAALNDTESSVRTCVAAIWARLAFVRVEDAFANEIDDSVPHFAGGEQDGARRSLSNHPVRGMRAAAGQHRVADVDEVERLLRRLAVNDEESVDRVLVSGPEPLPPPMLSEKVELLVRLAALLALGAATASLRTMVERAIAAGATESEIVEVLIAVGPAVGLARVVAEAPRLALALGYQIDADE